MHPFAAECRLKISAAELYPSFVLLVVASARRGVECLPPASPPVVSSFLLHPSSQPYPFLLIA